MNALGRVKSPPEPFNDNTDDEGNLFEMLFMFAPLSRWNDYFLPIKSSIRAIRFVIVPIGKNHNPKMHTMINTVRAQDKPNAKQAKTTKAASPYPTKMDFINVERGSIPTVLTRFDQGPSRPAYTPLLGVV